MSIESQITSRVEREIDHRNISIIAHRCGCYTWPRGLGAATTLNGLIVINDTFSKLDLDAGVFFVKHEIGHINNRVREENTSSVFKALACAIPIIGVGLVLKSGSLALTMGAAVACILFSQIGEKVLERKKEYWADSFAIKTATNAELKGGLRVFEASMQADRLINGSESNSWNNTHPTDRSRFKRIETELKKRGETTDITSQEDKQKIQDMMAWEILESSCKIPQDKKPLINEFKKRLVHLS